MSISCVIIISRECGTHMLAVNGADKENDKFKDSEHEPVFCSRRSFLLCLKSQIFKQFNNIFLVGIRRSSCALF